MKRGTSFYFPWFLISSYIHLYLFFTKMTKFSIEKSKLIDEFGKTNGWCRSEFQALESLYNQIFCTNLHSKCPACARGRYVESLKNWYKLSLKFFDKQGLTTSNEFGLPLGLSIKTMNNFQREQYNSLTRDLKSKYNKLSKQSQLSQSQSQLSQSKVAYDQIEDVIE